MRRLFVFGDSYTQKWEYNSPYSMWKGYTPKTYSELISEELGIECFNFSWGGWSNYDIFEAVCQNIDSIKENDIVIILWSGLDRIRLVNHRLNMWVSIQPNSFNMLKRVELIDDDISENTIDELMINRQHNLYKEEVRNWIKLLKHTFKSNIFINSTWYGVNWGIDVAQYETIVEESNNQMIDWHWSEKGQYDFAQWCISKIKTDKFVGVN